MLCAETGGLCLPVSFHFFFWQSLVSFRQLRRGIIRQVSACRAQICRSPNAPMLGQGFDMLIDRTGDYRSNGFESAHAFGLRGANCIGYIIQPDGGKMAAVWHSKDGTRINGPADENLVRFGRPKKPKFAAIFIKAEMQKARKLSLKMNTTMEIRGRGWNCSSGRRDFADSLSAAFAWTGNSVTGEAAETRRQAIP